MFAKSKIRRQPARTETGFFDAENAPGDRMADDIRTLFSKARALFDTDSREV